MDAFVVTGGHKLNGETHVSGAKNVSMKAVLAGILTDEPLNISNVPFISSLSGTIAIVKRLGVAVHVGQRHTLLIKGDSLRGYTVPLELGGLYRTATMVIGPLLARFGKAIVPNPGGCRIGKRPINWHIEGLRKMGAHISYKEGFFYARTQKKLQGTRFTFKNNTHTGTETLILAAVLAEGETVLENAALEPEIDDMISLLTSMGARVKRTTGRTIVIQGVNKLHGANHTVMPDRNEVVTFAIGALATGGDVIIHGAIKEHLTAFLSAIDKTGGLWKDLSGNRIRFFGRKKLHSTDVITAPYPGFMTDWQGPWTILMTQAKGNSILHETVYEDRFGYVKELQKMGADIEYFNPRVTNPETVYNFQWKDRKTGSFHALKIHGPRKLHNAVLEVTDLRAGSTLVIAASVADGVSYVRGVDHIDRGYENLENRLSKLGMRIKRITE